jgi:hypothetical protein
MKSKYYLFVFRLWELLIKRIFDLLIFSNISITLIANLKTINFICNEKRISIRSNVSNELNLNKRL